jgi:pimeloyl-ACP methyl ester carboxylesterase
LRFGRGDFPYNGRLVGSRHPGNVRIVFDQLQSETTLFDEEWLGDEPESRRLELDSPEGPIGVQYWDSAPGADDGRLAEATASAKPQSTLSIVAIHGLFDSKRVWRYVWRHLAARWRLVAPDLPGMGLSGKPKLSHLPRAERYTPAWLSGMLRRIVEAVGGLDDIVLVGHSYGGALSLLSLLDESFARRVRGLVLIGAAAYPQRLPPFVARFRGFFGAIASCPLWHDWLAAWLIRRGRAAAGVEATYRLGTFDLSNVPREALETAVAVVSSPGFPRAARYIARRLIPKDHAALVERFSEIAIPALVIWGRDDRLVPPEHAERFGRDLQRARVVMYDRCGHWPQHEKAREMALEIERFMDDMTEPDPA